MPIKRWSAPNVYIWMHLNEPVHHPRQIALQVNTQGQKIRNHQDVPYPATRQARHGFVQAGFCL